MTRLKRTKPTQSPEEAGRYVHRGSSRQAGRVSRPGATRVEVRSTINRLSAGQLSASGPAALDPAMTAQPEDS